MKRLAYLLRALRYPEKRNSNFSLLRYLLLEPRIFDGVSCAMQLRDLVRLGKIRETALEDPFYARVHRYNTGVARKKVITRTRRAEILYQILSVPSRDLGKEQLLIVGPRDVHELLIAWLYGYRWDNIHAIDLYSTNPKIAVMNM